MKFLAMFLVVAVAVAFLGTIANSEDAVELMEPRQSESESSPIARPRRCDSLNKAQVSFQRLIVLSPFYLYQCNSVSLNCSQTAYVNPSNGRTDYTGHIVIITLATTSSMEVQWINNNTVIRATWCSTNLKGDYPIVHSNFRGNSSNFCAVKCTDDGAGYDAVFCLGRTPADEAETQNFIDTTLRGVPGILNTQAGCPKPQYCDFFHY